MAKVIAKALPSDLPEIMRILEAAREFMCATGNPRQWVGGYPQATVIQADIAAGAGYVVREGNVPVAYFACYPSPEPTYSRIEGGAWLDDRLPYHVIHRLGSIPGSHGIFRSVMDWCLALDPNIRMDTHRDNRIMQHCAERYGFTYCGIIHLLSGDERLAYQLIAPASDEAPGFRD